MTDPPPLPRYLGDMRTVVATGTVVWVLGAAALLVAWLVAGRPLDLWFSTCVAGAIFGGIGYGIFTWQLSAARRGSRTAQEGIE